MDLLQVLAIKYIKDDYGKFYQIRILVQNLTNDSYTFAPDIIHADITKKNGTTETLRVYSNEAFGMAGYQTSYVTTRSYNGYTYTQPVTTYNSTAAYQANMAATTQLMVLSKQMEQDKKIREEGYLKKTTIHSSEGIFGYMNVEREKGTVMRVVIPVNGENYGFHWDVANKKKQAMEKPFSKIKPIKKILFLHGFTSGGDCEIARTLSDFL